MMPMPGDLATLEAAIIGACAEHERDHRWDKDYRRCLVIQGYFVKFDSYQSLYPEVQMQMYVFQRSEHDMNAPCIPKILHFFNRDYRMAYAVMEYIKLTFTPVPDLHQRVALALQWLRDLPAPPDLVRIGPLRRRSCPQ
jgi:hypothetical protein